ncbi:glycosyltransferase family protein [Parachitinimonas caeni]|uniref:Glycosyltransferase family protein n=1 Tax=Parachitinimonas caeni TaxID=3031301 RepID=A0ABT7E0M3_9NEIS|nr:glycosyltransferase family protein [Parachitinimonas caeni]MDK2125871.1 glycosyltransferase family protein [Parachitinimonas caeni]
MTVAVIVQARMGSTRLPGKVLKTVLGIPLLQIQLQRLQRIHNADCIVVATTTEVADEPILALCQALQIPCWRGSQDDVLSRYAGAARSVLADVVVRVTSDCPLIDPDISASVIHRFALGDADYVSNSLSPTYPRGLDTEVFSAASLYQADQLARLPFEREHVTPFLYRHPERFRLAEVRCERDLSEYRWTVDTPEDFELIRRMLEALAPDWRDFRLDDCLALMALHPDWPALNAHIEQKKLGQ